MTTTVRVYRFEVPDVRKGTLVSAEGKATRDAIAVIPGAQVIEGTEQVVAESMLTRGHRYYPRTAIAEPIAFGGDGKSLCRPSEGYVGSLEVDLNEWEVSRTFHGDLPPTDEAWPKGAPIEKFVKVGEAILKRRPM